MALKVLQPGIFPIGQYDCLDADLTTIKGGEVLVFDSVTLAGSDKSARDGAFDGYLNSLKRPVVRKVTTGDDSTKKPVMLADEGIAGYGTIFGTVVGGTAGQSISGTVLGPTSALGSGKVTAWDKPGLYAISLDTVDATIAPTASIVAGAALGVTTAGVLTTAAGILGGPVARFIDFETKGSLVTTPANLVNSLSTRTYDYVVVHFTAGY
jgi:hypothetical protein